MHNFSFLILGVLAGTDLPRGKKDLQQLAHEGIKVLVTVMEECLDEKAVNQAGLEYHCFPVPPYGTPSLEQLDQFIDLVNKNRAKNRPVTVHCYMGWGRTGTFLAAYLISEGKGAEEAIYEVREKRPGSIETMGQEQILRIFAQSLLARGPG